VISRSSLACVAFALLVGYASAGRPPSAKAALAASMKQAKKEGKQVLVMFKASWCGPCQKAQEYLQKPTLARFIDKYYVLVKLDCLEKKNRPDLENEGADSEKARLCGVKPSLPSFAILDSDGALKWDFVGRRDGLEKPMNFGEGKGFIGLFLLMLHQASPKIPMSDLRQLRSFMDAQSDARMKSAR